MPPKERGSSGASPEGAGRGAGPSGRAAAPASPRGPGSSRAYPEGAGRGAGPRVAPGTAVPTQTARGPEVGAPGGGGQASAAPVMPAGSLQSRKRERESVGDAEAQGRGPKMQRQEAASYSEAVRGGKPAEGVELIIAGPHIAELSSREVEAAESHICEAKFRLPNMGAHVGLVMNVVRRRMVVKCQDKQAADFIREVVRLMPALPSGRSAHLFLPSDLPRPTRVEAHVEGALAPYPQRFTRALESVLGVRATSIRMFNARDIRHSKHGGHACTLTLGLLPEAMRALRARNMRAVVGIRHTVFRLQGPDRSEEVARPAEVAAEGPAEAEVRGSAGESPAEGERAVGDQPGPASQPQLEAQPEPMVSTPAHSQGGPVEAERLPSLEESAVEAQRVGNSTSGSVVEDSESSGAPLAPLAKQEDLEDEESVEALLEGLEVHDQQEPMEEETGLMPDGGPNGGPSGSH